MRSRVALVVLAAAAAFGGAYAVGRADRPSERVQARVPDAGRRAPVPQRVPVPAGTKLPSLRAAALAPAPAPQRPPARRPVGRAAPSPAPAPAPRPAPKPRPKPDSGIPFFDQE